MDRTEYLYLRKTAGFKANMKAFLHGVTNSLTGVASTTVGAQHLPIRYSLNLKKMRLGIKPNKYPIVKTNLHTGMPQIESRLGAEIERINSEATSYNNKYIFPRNMEDRVTNLQRDYAYAKEFNTVPKGVNNIQDFGSSIDKEIARNNRKSHLIGVVTNTKTPVGKELRDRTLAYNAGVYAKDIAASFALKKFF